MTTLLDEPRPAAPPPDEPETAGDRPSRYRIDVREMSVLIEAGHLSGRVELADGSLIHMPSQGTPHRLSVTLSFIAFQRGWQWPRFVSVQGTHKFTEHDAPEPDLCLLDRPPTTDAVIDELPRLVVEISDSTLGTDLGRKKRDYARFGVPEYWVLDLRHRRLYVFRQPDTAATEAADAWGEERILNDGDTVTALCMPDTPITVRELIEGPAAE